MQGRGKMKRRYISFMTQISLICVGIVLLPFIGIMAFFAVDMSQKIDEEYRTVLEKANIQIDTGISSIFSDVERLSYLHVVNDSLSEALRHKHEVYDRSFLDDNKVVTNIVRDAVLLNPNIYSVVIINNAGNAYDNSFNSYYWKNMYSDLPIWGELAKSLPGRRFINIQYRSSNEPEALMLVKPLEDIERGKTLGTIGITISFRSIRNVLNNAVQNHGNLVVYNEDGTPVYTYSSSDVQDKEVVINDIWKELQSDNTDQSSAVKDFTINRVSYIGGVQKLEQLGWTVVNYTNRSYIRSIYYQNIRMFMIITVLVIVFDLLIAFIFIRRLNISVHGLCQAMENSGEKGILESIHPERTEFKTEIDMLIHSYNNVIRRLKDSMERSLELQMNEQRMEFRMLQAQINPHFLYNTFNLISSIAGIQGVDSICKITGCISDMFRYSIQESLIVNLKDELREVNNYVTIQTIRFKDRLYADFDIEEETLETPVPIFLLQPLVENAIIHGLEPKEGIGYISVVAYMADDEVELIVKDNGVGISPVKMKELLKAMEKEQIEPISTEGHSSIGIKNVNQRIKAYYGDAYGIRLESRQNSGTSVVIRIPKNIIKRI